MQIKSCLVPFLLEYHVVGRSKGMVGPGFVATVHDAMEDTVNSLMEYNGR